MIGNVPLRLNTMRPEIFSVPLAFFLTYVVLQFTGNRQCKISECCLADVCKLVRLLRLRMTVDHSTAKIETRTRQSFRILHEFNVYINDLCTYLDEQQHTIKTPEENDARELCLLVAALLI